MLHHTEHGTGDPIVLLHSGGLDLRMWDAQVDDLARTHRVIRADARGHGRSETPTAPFRQCDDIADLITGLGLDGAVLVGVSMGGGAATDTALEHPHLVRGLVVCGAGTNEPEFTDPWLLDLRRRMADAAAAGDAATWIDLYLRPLVIGPHRTAADIDPDVLARCRDMVTATVTRHVRPDAVAPTPVSGSWERLGEIAVPTLGVHGDLDVTDHIAMTRRFAHATGGDTVCVAGTGHLPMMERPALFTGVLRDFLKGL